jgi:hypothetical protein
MRQEAAVPIKAALFTLSLLAVTVMTGPSCAQSSLRQWTPEDGSKKSRMYRQTVPELNDRNAAETARSSSRRGPIDSDNSGGPQNTYTDDNIGVLPRSGPPRER